MLVHFPIAFWTAANACDALALSGVSGAWALAWLLLILGTATGFATATAGFLDFLRVENEAAPAATRHMLLMGSAWCAYLAALLTRTHGKAPLAEPAMLPVTLGALGFVLLAVGGHMGASLVYRHGVGRQPAKG